MSILKSKFPETLRGKTQHLHNIEHQPETADQIKIAQLENSVKNLNASMDKIVELLQSKISQEDKKNRRLHVIM